MGLWFWNQWGSIHVTYQPIDTHSFCIIPNIQRSIYTRLSQVPSLRLSLSLFYSLSIYISTPNFGFFGISFGSSVSFFDCMHCNLRPYLNPTRPTSYYSVSQTQLMLTQTLCHQHQMWFQLSFDRPVLRFQLYLIGQCWNSQSDHVLFSVLFRFFSSFFGSWNWIRISCLKNRAFISINVFRLN